MLEMIVEAGKYIGFILILGIVWLISYCVFHGDGVKTWTKTVWFLLLSGSFLAVITWLCLRTCSQTGAGFPWVLVAVMGVLFSFVAVYGHKKGWKQDL
ncbi:MAG: hypothetical protein IIV61_00345 [Oscillospiraceae bacterium]|nr:hypothetical protein [Oscillospiraceae bacterium]